MFTSLSSNSRENGFIYLWSLIRLEILNYKTAHKTI